MLHQALVGVGQRGRCPVFTVAGGRNVQKLSLTLFLRILDPMREQGSIAQRHDLRQFRRMPEKLAACRDGLRLRPLRAAPNGITQGVGAIFQSFDPAQ